jgi:hypothetical protein
MRRILVLTCAFALLVVTGAAAQEAITGTVARIDPGSSVIILSDGRMYQTSAGTIILVNEQPATFTTLEPGTQIVLREATPVIYREDRYVVVTESPSASPAMTETVAVVPPPPPVAVYEEPAIAGQVIRAYTPDRTLYFGDGRKVEVRPDSTLLVNNEVAAWGNMTPGTNVVVERPGRITRYAPSPASGRGPTDENYDITGSPIQQP